MRSIDAMEQNPVLSVQKLYGLLQFGSRDIIPRALNLTTPTSFLVSSQAQLSFNELIFGFEYQSTGVENLQVHYKVSKKFVTYENARTQSCCQYY